MRVEKYYAPTVKEVYVVKNKRGGVIDAASDDFLWYCLSKKGNYPETLKEMMKASSGEKG